jgi:hypothetical protein
MSTPQDIKKIPVDREDLLLLLKMAVDNDEVDWMSCHVLTPIEDLTPGMFIDRRTGMHILGDLRISDFPELEPPEKDYENWN